MQKQLARLLLLVVTTAILVVAVGADNTPQMEAAQEILQSQQVYIVGYSEDHTPFSYINSEGEVTGMAIDMMNHIAEVSGIQVEYVSLREADTQVDISLSILRLDQRKENSTRSTPYFNFQMMLLGEGDTFNLENAKIGHLDYSAIDDEMIEAGIPGCEAYTYQEYGSLEAALKAGDVDYILTSNLVVKQTSLLSQSIDLNSQVADMTLDLMLKYNDSLSQEQMDAFNAVIEELDVEYTYNIMLNAAVVAATNETGTLEFIMQHKVEISVTILATIAIIVAIILYFNLNRRKILLQNLYVDDLTGLMTERKFFDYVIAKLRKAKKHNTYYIISMDIDNFKYINENYGYEKGTETILAFADMLKSAFEEAECIARPFADNFLIFTKVAPKPNFICGRDSCRHCMDYCLTGILGSDYKLMTSAGIYRIEDTSLGLSYMIDCANIARRRGKNTYARTEVIFTHQVEEELKAKNEIIASMEQAIQRREFKMHYQPKIDFKTKEIIGAEALVRWYTPNGNQVFPNQFIHLFEQNGFISRLDYYVLNEVCEFLTKHPEMPKISVNLSGYSFLDYRLTENVLEITERNQISPSRIEIEITESAIVNEFEIIVKKIDELRACGFAVSMDDFGAGLSSLHRLKDISIDELKIDREFLGTGPLSDKGVSIIDSIIQMSQRISVTTVAEGVETVEQVKLLAGLNCNVAQGYYYSRPLAEDAFVSYVEQYEGDKTTT